MAFGSFSVAFFADFVVPGPSASGALHPSNLLADKQGHVLLSYIINMAMIEASTGTGKQIEDGEGSAKVA